LAGHEATTAAVADPALAADMGCEKGHLCLGDAATT
jgi:hypothetical protein